jgi:hypothetical protein
VPKIILQQYRSSTDTPTTSPARRLHLNTGPTGGRSPGRCARTDLTVDADMDAMDPTPSPHPHIRASEARAEKMLAILSVLGMLYFEAARYWIK